MRKGDPMPVNTVRGPVEAQELGQTLVHEHISGADWSLRAAFGSRFYNHDVVLARAVEHFSRAKEHGVRTIVDGTPINMGRDVSLVREVAERTGLNLIVSTGFYYTEELYTTWRGADEIAAWLHRECLEGIADTGIRPGILKAACAEAGITATLEKVFRAIGLVAAEQQLPIFTHHDVKTANGPAILDLFEDSGVSADKVVLGHSGDTNDLGYLGELLERGCWLGMDRFGYCDVGNSLENRVQTIVELCARGHAARLLLSHDLAIYFGVFGSWEDFEAHDPMAGGVDYTFIHRQVLPALVAAGLTEDTVRALLVNNPRNLFTSS